MLVLFSPIFVADTKITCFYNFVAPLISLNVCNNVNNVDFVIYVNRAYTDYINKLYYNLIN